MAAIEGLAVQVGYSGFFLIVALQHDGYFDTTNRGKNASKRIETHAQAAIHAHHFVLDLFRPP